MKPFLVDVPVLILFFNRPQQLSQVFEQVRNARPSKLFLYQDGPRSEHDLPGIKACREVTDQIDWDCEVHRMYQEKNYGCDPSEYISQKWAFSMVDKCIVLEDDDVPSVSFFTSIRHYSTKRRKKEHFRYFLCIPSRDNCLLKLAIPKATTAVTVAACSWYSGIFFV